MVPPQGEPIALTGSEFKMLQVFLGSPRRVLSRAFLLAATNGREPGGNDRAVDATIRRLRKKLAAHGDGAELVQTVRGAGYMFAAKVTAHSSP